MKLLLIPGKVLRIKTYIVDFLSSLYGAIRMRGTLNRINTFVMFIGYPRSGHSLIGALLDAHPNVIIAHEFNTLKYLSLLFSRSQIFYLLYNNSKGASLKGRQSTGYSYQVPSQWQGRFSELHVIGDKKGGGSAYILKNNPKLLKKLEKKVKYPIKYIHVYRNPFDNITSWARGGNVVRKEVTEIDLVRITEKYFKTVSLIDELRNLPSFSIFDLKHEDFIKDPSYWLEELCVFIGVPTDQEYIEACSKIVFENPKKRRFEIEWPKHIIDSIQERNASHPLLKDYWYDK